jgi:hypothetical protein
MAAVSLRAVEGMITLLSMTFFSLYVSYAFR